MFSMSPNKLNNLILIQGTFVPNCVQIRAVLLCDICSPPLPLPPDGRRICFGADHVSVRFDIDVTLSGVQDISRTSGWIGTKFAWHDEDLIRLSWHFPAFQVHSRAK